MSEEHDAPPHPLAVAILAGGASRRMGRDKATIHIAGQTMLARVCAAAHNADLPVLVIGRGSNEIAEFPPGTRFIPDDTPGMGPLGALATALRHAPAKADILLSACDLPFITTAEFRWLADEAISEEQTLRRASSRGIASHGIVPTRNGYPEPLFAVYRQSCLPEVERLLASGRLAMRDLLNAAPFTMLDLPDRHTRATEDVDTPQQLATAIDNIGAG